MRDAGFPLPDGLAGVEPVLPLPAVERLLSEVLLPVGVVRNLLVAAGLSADEAERMVRGALRGAAT